MSRMTLLQAMADPNLFASWFRNRKTLGLVVRLPASTVRTSNDQ